MSTNHLANEKSPYLLQHAHNPVDWYPWGEEAFDKARRDEKPIFLSVGYSTCHWCHVMERESFESEQIAALLNRNFVSIKVDREERPDVDRVYMTFVQATTGGGGWPMSVWLTPDLKPFFGGTYFPPENRYGQPGFATVLERVAEAWRDDRAKILESSADVVEQLRAHLAPADGGGGRRIDTHVLEGAFYAFRRGYDTRYGGFGGAPKFPRPSVHNFLLRYYARTGNREALDMVVATLKAMARGGMHDHLGGGFHRYSVDERWFVPHFEKMLYDQAQLAISFVEAFQITGDTALAGSARGTLDYVLREMRHPEGGFYSAEDADSATDASRPAVKREGAFYVWTRAEIDAAGADPATSWFAWRYGVDEQGNVPEDPHGEFRGKNILWEAHTLEETAGHFGKPLAEVEAGVSATARKLLEERSRRPRPHLDDKVLTAWNGLIISALARAGAVLGEPAYTEAAIRAAEFVLARLYDPRTGLLLRRYREGESAIFGFLDDYAFFTQGMLDLYEAVFDLRYLELAAKLTAKQRDLFEDREAGGFFSSGREDGNLVLRIKEDYDGAEPSGNSVAASNLLRLAAMTGRVECREAAQKTLEAFAQRLAELPAALPQMLAACEFSMAPPREIVVVGERGAPDTEKLLHTAHARFLPNRVMLLVDGGDARRVLSGYLPAIAGMQKSGNRATAYVCENYACQLPTPEAEKLAELLQ